MANLRKTTRLKFLGNSKKNIKYGIVVMILTKSGVYIYIYIRYSNMTASITDVLRLKRIDKICIQQSFQYSEIKYV